MTWLMESVQNPKAVSHGFPQPLGNLATAARFPHSHSLASARAGRMENQRQVSHRPVAPRNDCCSPSFSLREGAKVLPMRVD